MIRAGRLPALLISALLSHPATATSQQPLGQTVEDPEAYAVYASLLPNEWTVRVARAKTLVVQRETGTNWKCMPSGKPLETDWKPVLDDFRTQNADARELRPGFALGTPYVVVPRADIQATFREVANDPMFGWTGFYKKHPDSGGFMVVSAVGFDAVKQRAIVYMAHSCGSLCGGGTHHLLEKIGDVWRQARIPGVTNCSWAS
jgi:hypothetical protein